MLREGVSVQLWLCTGILPQGDPDSPSFREFWVCKMAQAWELIKDPKLCFYDPVLDFCSLHLELFSFYKWNNLLVFYFNAQSLWLISQKHRSAWFRLFWLLFWQLSIKSSTLTLPVVRVMPLNPSHLESNYSHCIYISQLSDFSPMKRSCLHIRATTELLKDAGVPLRGLFLRVLVKGMSSGTSLCWRVGLKSHNHSNIPFSLSLWMPSSTLNQGRSGFSNSLTVVHLLVHVSVRAGRLLDMSRERGM